MDCNDPAQTNALLGDSRSSDVSFEEKAQILASRIIHSQGICMPIFHVSLLAASVTEIVWIMHPWAEEGCCRISYPTSPLALAVEAYLTLGLLGETLLRMAWLRAAFWAAWGNVVDCTVSGLSLLSFLLLLLLALSLLSFVLYVRQTSQDLELVVLVLMICWLLLRIVRLYTVAKNLATSHRRRSTKSEIRFDFGDNDADESAPV